MMLSWKFINGEKIMFPTSSKDAVDLKWTQVRHTTVNTLDYYVVDSWLKEHVQDRAYYLGALATYFYRDSDALMFRLKWA